MLLNLILTITLQTKKLKLILLVKESKYMSHLMTSSLKWPHSSLFEYISWLDLVEHKSLLNQQSQIDWNQQQWKHLSIPTHNIVNNYSLLKKCFLKSCSMILLLRFILLVLSLTPLTICLLCNQLQFCLINKRHYFLAQRRLIWYFWLLCQSLPLYFKIQRRQVSCQRNLNKKYWIMGMKMRKTYCINSNN